MATHASQPTDDFVPKHWAEPIPSSALDHIPGDAGLPVVGNTFKLLSDPPSYITKRVAEYGLVYKNRAFGIWSVSLIGADANELVMFNKDKIFSSEQGWGHALDKLFPRGLMLMDFDHHRMDRRALSIAFKPGPMRHYTGALNRGIAAEVKGWGDTPMEFYPAIKKLTLNLAADSFIGIPWGPEADRINGAFVDMVQASIAPIRAPLPFTSMKRGVDGRKYLVDFFSRETLRRRETGGGQDMFSQFATATREDGELLSVDEVADHMNFLMMAAHDTITSSVTALVWLLGKNPEWQARLRDEIRSVIGDGADGHVDYDQLGALELTEMAFKEALRVKAPVPTIPRRALKSFEYGGYRIPAGTHIALSPHYVHHMPEYWDEPEIFDPLRFTPDKVKARHKYAWVPFSGGAHMCLGLHFAYMQVKLLMSHILTSYEIVLEEGYDPQWQPWPIPKPRDGLKLTLKSL